MAGEQQSNDTLTVDSGITQIAEDVFAITGMIRFERYLGVPHRMTVFRIPQTSDLVVYSPFDPDLIDISSLGTVIAIVAPSYFHHVYAQKFLAAHPGATLYSSSGLSERFADRDWGTIIGEETAEDVISPHVLVKKIYAIPLKEVVLLHVASGTIAVADIAFNLNWEMMATAPFVGRWYYRLASSPRALDIHVLVRNLIKPYCEKVLPELRGLLEDWEWERCVPCHGEVVERGGKEAFRNGTYRFVKSRVERGEWSTGQTVSIGLIGIVFAAGAAVIMQRRGLKMRNDNGGR